MTPEEQATVDAVTAKLAHGIGPGFLARGRQSGRPRTWEVIGPSRAAYSEWAVRCVEDGSLSDTTTQWLQSNRVER